MTSHPPITAWGPRFFLFLPEQDSGSFAKILSKHQIDIETVEGYFEKYLGYAPYTDVDAKDCYLWR
jgi:hypothetical protein